MTMGYLLIETGIIFTIGIVFKNPNLIIWGLFGLFLSSRVCDMTMEGLPDIKGVYIVSEKPDEIKQDIFDKLDRGVTIFFGEGGYRGDKKKIIMCVISRRQMSTLRDAVRRIDPGAFMILTDISDVMGYGFKSKHVELGDTTH